MANYKVVDADQLDADLASVADAIRAKAGATEQMAFPADFKSVVDGIQTGGGSGDIPSAETAEFGRVKEVAGVAPDGKSYFNGTILPDIPADVLSQYPYAWIRKNESTGNYDLLLSAKVWYYSTNVSSSGTCPWYVIELSSADTAVEWKFNKDSAGVFGVDSARTIMWSNHDIPEGSSTATDIHFYGSEPVKELVSGYGDFVPGAECYAVENQTIREIAHKMQIHHDTYEIFTGEEIRDFLIRCDFFEKSTGETVLDASGLSFTTTATAVLT